MEKKDEGLKSDAIASKWLFPFLLIVFGLAWSLFALFIFATDWVVGTFGELSGSHPLIILAVYAPAIAALLLIGFTAGWSGTGRFLSRIFLWRASPWWYAFLLLGFMSFFAGSVACSVILMPLFNDARGSILLAMLFHFQMNNPLWPDAQPYDMYVYVAAAVIVVWLNRRSLFSKVGAVTEVIPTPAASGSG